MPGRCSQEKGTAEARSGERKRWWNGEGAGEKDGKEKERPEEAEDDEDEEVEDAEVPEVDVGTVELEEDVDDGRSCLRRRRRRVAARQARVVVVWWSGGAGAERRWAFMVGPWRGDVIRMRRSGLILVIFCIRDIGSRR
uniref:Uncharacterized protein n=1 Tax=Setaria italica TaxID=4555 RepID=K3YCN1_SETIT